MASFSCRISPRTSTVIFLDRSPLATAMVTSAMLRTCAVRLPAIWLTDSVSSFQTPDTPFTCAWPPSLPSVPTSRATRVTSEVNTESWSIILLTSLAERRNSPSSGRPSTSSAIAWPRSPLATAPTARVTSVVGHTRSSISVLIAATSSAHPPITPGTVMRCLSLPSLPTMRDTRAVSRARRSLTAAMSLKTSAILPSRPTMSVGRRTAKSPSRSETSAASSWRVNASPPPRPPGGGAPSPATGNTPPPMTAGSDSTTGDAAATRVVSMALRSNRWQLVSSRFAGVEPSKSAVVARRAVESACNVRRPTRRQGLIHKGRVANSVRCEQSSPPQRPPLHTEGPFRMRPMGGREVRP